MDELTAIFIQDIAFREQAKLKTYSRQVTDPINQIINSPTTASNIVQAAYKQHTKHQKQS